ncbi:hypothetical protein GCM10007036_10380 [Alsobacter metallidurans]|uniref:Uncharacterized protein n=1 Tax=Alsobacter metallidurans TaxID=340221 RepID=A0A917MG28_9HYPH|nr:hypothetical protein [Alsobacter metallidurans]GGH12506.1 hypothetical protein GCM10007036_10380 [Alsobacter metallidurans]
MDEDAERTRISKLAAELVAKFGELGTETLSTEVAKFLARHPDIDADVFMDIAIDLYLERRRPRRLH